MSFVEVTEGASPVILGLPHTGTKVPDEVRDKFNETGRALADTDWHIHDLYAGLLDGATSVRTVIHRYVIDVNRDPKGASLYPGQNTTALCPLTDFDGQSIYRDRMQPDEAEIADRCARYHRPYHDAMRAQIDRVRAKHGFAILYDCHSIRSRIPFLFDGPLPDFNIGTNEGQSCAASIAQAVAAICARADSHSSVIDGRFKGGWTTRHYGRPSEGVHAIQMELAQCTYMQEAPPWLYERAKADRLREHLRTILRTLSDWKPS